MLIIGIRAEGRRPAPELTHPPPAPLCSELRAGRCAQATLLKTRAPSEDALAPRHARAQQESSIGDGRAPWRAGMLAEGVKDNFVISTRRPDLTV